MMNTIKLFNNKTHGVDQQFVLEKFKRGFTSKHFWS